MSLPITILGPVEGIWENIKPSTEFDYDYFGLKLREDVKQRVKGCANCVSYSVWRTRKQELHFLGPSPSHFILCISIYGYLEQSYIRIKKYST